MRYNRDMKILCAGQAVVDCITRNIDKESLKNRSARAESIRLNVGGDALNESVILSRLGHEVQTACLIGDDLAGKIILNALKENGVDTSLVQTEEIDTVIADIFAEEDGSRRSLNSNAVKLGGKSLSAENIRDIDALSLASLFRAPLDDPKKVLELVVKAKSEGAYVFADTKLPVYKKLTLEDYAEVLPYIDLIFPNETEAAYYSGISGDKEEDLAAMADVFLKKGVKAVVIKTGEQGSWYFDGEQRFHHPAFAADVVDTTGAGDNYAAGFIHAYLNKILIPGCMKLASACAALSVAASGATGGVKSLQQIENYLQKK